MKKSQGVVISFVCVSLLLFVSFSWGEEVITLEDKTIETLRIDTVQKFFFKWISFESNGNEVAYVNGKCEIVKNRKVGRHIQAELERYKGICEDIKTLENETPLKNVRKGGVK